MMTTGPADLVPSTVLAFFSVFIGAALLSERLPSFSVLDAC